MFDFDDALDILGTLTREDIHQMFAPADVDRGWRLYQSGQVHDRELVSDAFEGYGIEAVVDDGRESYIVGMFVESQDEFATICDCSRYGDCEHTVALLFAWLEEPTSFTSTELGAGAPQTVGELLDMLAANPSLRETIADNVPEFEEFMEMVNAGTLDVGPLIDLTLDEFQALVATQAHVARTVVDPEAADRALRQLLENLTVPELRGIGRRRDFQLRGTRKADIIDQLVASLRDTTGQPEFLAGLTGEEYEALRALNTVYGIRTSLTWDEAQWAWNQCGPKGSPKRLRKALGGLQEYGLLYRCGVHDGTEHYHWLPYLIGVRLPVLVPKVKTYPGRKVRRLSRPADTPSVPAALALLVAFAEQHPLHLRKPRARHRQAGFYPWLGEWDHDPDEVERLIAGRSGNLFPGSGTTLTVPPPQSLLADDVLDQLAGWIGGDREFASWVMLLAVAAGILAQPTDAKVPPAVQHEQWKAWYSLPPETQLRALFDVWRHGILGMTELGLAQRREPALHVQRTLTYQYPHAQQQFTPSDLAYELSLARGFVTRLLQELPANVWYDWSSFAEVAWRLDPDFLHNYYGTDFWGFVLKGNKRLDPSRRSDWNRGYRPILAAIFEGPLEWLGVVEVGYKGSNLVAFRVTPTGAWLLRGEGRPTPLLAEETEQAPVAWLDDRTFRVRPGPHAANVLALASAPSTSSGQAPSTSSGQAPSTSSGQAPSASSGQAPSTSSGQAPSAGLRAGLAMPTRKAFVYELSDEGIQQAFARGVEPAAIAETFEKAGAPLPTATHQRIEDLWSRFGHIHLYEKLTVLEFADDLALRELLANTSLRQHIIHQFSPRLVVVEDSAVDALVEELIKKGYTPKVED